MSYVHVSYVKDLFTNIQKQWSWKLGYFLTNLQISRANNSMIFRIKIAKFSGSFIWTQKYREIFKYALMYIKIAHSKNENEDVRDSFSTVNMLHGGSKAFDYFKEIISLTKFHKGQRWKRSDHCLRLHWFSWSSVDALKNKKLRCRDFMQWIELCGQKDYYYLGQRKIRKNTSFYTGCIRLGK